MRRSVEPGHGGTWRGGTGFLEEWTSRLRPRSKGQEGRSREGGRRERHASGTGMEVSNSLGWDLRLIEEIRGHGGWGAGQWGERSLESCPTADKVLESSKKTEGNLVLESQGSQHLAGSLTTLRPLYPHQGQHSPMPSGHRACMPLAFLTLGCCLEAPFSSRKISQVRVMGCEGCGERGLGTGAPPEAAGPS